MPVVVTPSRWRSTRSSTWAACSRLSASGTQSLGTTLGHDFGIMPRMLYAAKCYWPGATEEELRDAADRTHRQDATEDSPVFRGLLYLRGDETALALFEGDSGASVKQASEDVGMPCERVIESGWFGPPAEGGTR